MAPSGGPLATPTQTNYSRFRSGSNDVVDKSPSRPDAALVPPSARPMDARSMSSAGMYNSRNASVATTAIPGSFSSNLKTTNGARSINPGGGAGGLRIDFGGGSYVYNGRDEAQSAGAFSSEQEASEKRQAEFRDAINKELKIKTGSENLLEALMSKSNAKQTKDQRIKVESELNSSSRKIEELRTRLHDEIQRSKLNAAMSARPATPQAQPRPSFMSTREVMTADGGRRSLDEVASISQDEYEEEEDYEEESPSFVLAEILQSLESDGMQPDYYISRANAIVDLLQRHPTLKYDLAWSIFGLRVQTMLLSESRDVVAAGYRLTRHAIGDRKSLQIIRELQTDALVVLSLAKDQKSRIEREQALKFVRAFVDVKDGVKELSNAVVKAVISVAEHHEDALRNTALLTLAEILVREPRLLVAAGGILPLSEALKDGLYPGGESLVASLLFLSDTPERRKLLFVGQELEGPFGLFSDSLNAFGHEDRMRSGLKSIAAILNSWAGLFILSQTGFQSVRSLLMSLQHPAPVARDLILDLLFDILHIKPPAWTSSFLAGRRLTTYGRVRAMQPTEKKDEEAQDDAIERLSLLDHFTTLLLAVFVQCGLVPTLTTLVEEDEEEMTRRKATILLAEVQKLADHLLPASFSRPLQPLSSVMNLAIDFRSPGNAFDLHNMVYQLDSVSKTMTRTAPTGRPRGNSAGSQPPVSLVTVNSKTDTKFPADMPEVDFRDELNKSLVLNHVNYLKWRWDIIHDLVEGPLSNRRSFNIAANDTKWLKRVVGFYRPFKCRFSEARNIRANQRYVRTGSLLIKTLLKFPEGVQYLLENKLFRQLAECLAQIDPASGITSASPMFSSERIRETMCGGYFQMLGALTGNQHGLTIISRWRMLNMFYHITDLSDREDLIMALLGGLEFDIDSHLRVILSKALTACEKPIRIYATRLLRKYATQAENAPDGLSKTSGAAYWALRLLITQLYDPSVEVSEVAVGILHEACDRSEYLEFVVRCRPALDHLGEIGAPLLLRFLSSSNGYKYLSGLDYITQEMDDWFLGRNEKYVHVVEASLSRAIAFDETGRRERVATAGALDDEPGLISITQAASIVSEDRLGDVPPHFYRELVRTPDGCRLLEDSGHFEAFTRHIRNAADAAEHAARRNTVIEGSTDHTMSAATDGERVLRVKSCLWAVGNVGSMELGAPFLESSGVVERIITLVRQSPVVSVRGTAFFVLGLISRSFHGMEILAEHGWDAATDAMGRSLGYVLPPKLEVLFSLRDEKVRNREMMRPLAELHEMPPKANENDEWEARIYAAVVESGNTVLQRRALGELAAVKAKRPILFKNPIVLTNVMYVFECHTIKLPVRQRVFDMFDRIAMRMVVLEDNESEDGSEEGSSEEEGDPRSPGEESRGDSESSTESGGSDAESSESGNHSRNPSEVGGAARGPGQGTRPRFHSN